MTKIYMYMKIRSKYGFHGCVGGHPARGHCASKSFLCYSMCAIIVSLPSFLPRYFFNRPLVKYQKIGWDSGIKQQNSNMFNATDYSQQWNPCVVIIGAQHLELRLRCKGSAFERVKFYQIASQHVLWSHQIVTCCVLPIIVLIFFGKFPWVHVPNCWFNGKCVNLLLNL